MLTHLYAHRVPVAKKDFAQIVENEESKEETITTTADEGEAVDADMEDVVPVQKPSRRGRR